MGIIVRWSFGRETLLTVVIPGVCALGCGIVIVVGVYVGWAYPLHLDILVQSLVQNRKSAIEAAAILFLLAMPFWYVQYRRSCRPLLGLLGSVVVAVGLTGPVSIAVGSIDWQGGVFDINGLLVLTGPCLLMLLFGTMMLYCTRWFLDGWPILWSEGMCRRCGYSLLGSASGRCPECGAATEESGESTRDRESRSAL